MLLSVGALDDCHFVDILSRIFVHFGFLVIVLSCDLHSVHWLIVMLLSLCCHVCAFWHFVAFVLSFWCIGCLPCCCHVVVMLVHVFSYCCHCVVLWCSGWLSFVGMMLRILVHVGHLLAMLLSLCCHCGALDDCHVVVMLLSCWCMLAILLSFVVILVHSMIGMVLSFCCHFGAVWSLCCHCVVIVLSSWCIG